MLLIFCYLDDLFILRFVYYNFNQQQQQSQQVSLKLKRLGKKMVFFVIKSEYIYFPPEVIFFSAGNELSISMKVFLFLIYLTSFFSQKKYGVQQVPGVPRFADWQFSNTHDQVTVGFTLASDW